MHLDYERLNNDEKKIAMQDEAFISDNLDEIEEIYLSGLLENKEPKDAIRAAYDKVKSRIRMSELTKNAA